MISREFQRIIEATNTNNTIQEFMGVSNTQFLAFKRAEQWIKKRVKVDAKVQSKEKGSVFAKDLFKIWDDDNSGILDLNEISHPLVALGLSTDTKFVAKLVKSLGSKKTRSKGDANELQCSL